MRDLEKQIAAWRQNMAKAAGHRPEVLEELELHLRDEIDRLVRSGRSESDAFQTAVSGLGTPGALGAEFEKLSHARRAKWKPVTIAQVFCLGVAILSAGLLLMRLGNGRITPLLATHVLVVTIGYATMFIMGGLGICYMLANWLGHSGPTQRYALQRATLQFATLSVVFTVIGVVLGMFWTKENWGRYWGWDAKEVGALLVIGSGVITLSIRWLKSVDATAIAFVTIIGNIATAWGWFGANTGFQPGPALLAFTASQCAVLAAIPLSGLIKRDRATG